MLHIYNIRVILKNNKMHAFTCAILFKHLGEGLLLMQQLLFHYTIHYHTNFYQNNEKHIDLLE